jgi:signal transduction histidine kinase
MTFRFCPSPDLFATLFPFHLVLDRTLRIIQVGSVLHRLYPFMLGEHQDLHEHFRIRTPQSAVDFDSMRSQPNPVFILVLRHNDLKFKGRMQYLADDDALLFMGSPIVKNLSSLSKYGLALSDFLSHDPTTDLLFLLETQKSALVEAKAEAHQLALAQAQTHEALVQEQELNKLKTRFIHTASHEFRTPLGIISSSAGLLEDYGDKLNPEKKHKHFRQIQGSIKHMTTLLEDILLIEQANAGRLECQKERLNLIEFCHELVEEIVTSNSAERRFVMQISFLGRSIAAEENYPVWIDRKLVRQILFNLLSNALKYSDPDSEVNFEVAIDPDNILFRVTDRGIGILPEDRVKLFESFHRGSNVSTIQGTGLGLSIVKRCVDLHGGTIDLISEVNVGSTFTVNLPLDNLEPSFIDDKPIQTVITRSHMSLEKVILN